MTQAPFDYDVLVIGSGFGGSVTALRLSEKGYRVGVLEAGRRFRDEDFAKNSWHVRDYLFKPSVGCYGIQRIDLLSDGAFHRWLRHQRDRGRRCGGPLPSPARTSRSARDRWLHDRRELGCEPVAHHHRAGRARHRAVAEQG
jgi:choline dehydrogenase-like flavoprotein